jgi:hypothetical protein
VTQGLVEAGVGGVVASICQSVDPDNADYTADFGPCRGLHRGPHRGVAAHQLPSASAHPAR